MSTYREIRALADELNTAKVTRRRAAGEKLVQMLSLLEVRQRLVQEASRDNRRGAVAAAVQQRKALAQMWRYIILNAVVSVQTIARSASAKLSSNDIDMPFKLLRCCDIVDDTTYSASYHPSKLSRKEVKLVFNYCYDLLQNETALELAEERLLGMMAYLCSRREYVACMRPHQEIHAIVQEIEQRLTPKDPYSVDQSIINTAANIWENLLVTTTVELGIDMHLLMPGCIKIVAVWCKNTMEAERTGPTGEVAHVFKGLAALVRSDPEQAVAPLARHGRPILGLAKRRYTGGDTVLRRALEEYFLAHL